MESNAHYKTVGLIVLLLFAGLIIAGIWLSIGIDTRGYKLYAVYMSEGVSGLTNESLVKYNGVKVGGVKSVGISKRDPKKVRIVIKVADTTPISPNTYATLITQGITGSTFLGLGSNTTSMGSLRRIPHEPYPIIATKPSFFNQLETTMTELNDGLKKLFTDKNINNLNDSLDNLRKVSDVIANNDKEIDKTFKEMPSVLLEIKASINKFSDMTQHITAATEDVSAMVNSGKEGFEKISRQALPPAILFIRRLDLIAANLEQISQQIKQNPSVILRGNTPPQPGPGE